MRPLSRRLLLQSTMAGGGIIVLGGSLAACGDDTESGGASSSGGATRAATLQLSWTHSVQFGGSYLALAEGLYAANGLDVTLAPGGPNVAGDANTVSGVSLVNISGGDGVARSNAEGADLVIVGAQYQKSPGTILSLAEAPLDTPESLVGKRVGVAGTDTPALDAFLTINGLTKEDVEFIPSQYDPAPLVAGQIDGIFCFYNDLPVALQIQGIDGYSMLLADFGYNPMSQVYTVLRENLENDKRADIVSMIRAEAQGWQLYKEDPEAAAVLSVEQYPDAGLDPETQSVQAEVQLDIMYSDLTDENGFAWFSDEQVAENIELFGTLSLDVDESLWDRSILEEIYADGPTA